MIFLKELGKFRCRKISLEQKIAGFENSQHLNANVLSREALEDAVTNPEKCSQLTIRVSDYAVRVNSLTSEQQRDAITHTFTENM